MNCTKCGAQNIERYAGNSTWCKPCHGKQTNGRRNYRRAVLQRYKRLKGCAECGYNKDPVALQFDHIIPIRENRAAVQPGWSWKRIKNELKLCQVLCANCHAIKTHRKDR